MLNPMTVLVVGGAGYIGSHTVRALQKGGFEVAVLDNLSSGHAAALPQGVSLYQQDVQDTAALARVLEETQAEAVIHFAARIEVGESMRSPLAYYRNNVGGSLSLLEALQGAGRAVPLVFSSTAAVYGNAASAPIPEDAPLQPTSVYGETKLMTEQMIRAAHAAYGQPYTILRYFNVCGAAPEGDIGEAHHSQTHLIELACMTALGQRPQMAVYGDDYPTPDGTCIRDYIHVQDLAQAHVLALQALLEGRYDAATYNVGLGRGFSVREVLDTIDEVVGRPLPRVQAPRRPGDPASLVADAACIQAELGFAPEFPELRQMVETAWAWHRMHPHGFQEERV